MRTFFVTLNWNTTEYLIKLIETVEETTPEPHTWVVVENGSREAERADCINYCADRFRGAFGLFGVDRDGWGDPSIGRMDCVVIRSSENLGCVLGHNMAFDMCALLGKDGAYEIVMMDTDVEVYEHGWLSRVREFCSHLPEPRLDDYHKVELPTKNIGIVGLEHSNAEVCAGAVFLDPSGNWYLHRDQTHTASPVRAESVGLGMALLRWPVPTLRFDTGFKLYYKQDDDLCFQVRANLGVEVWAYPIDMVHWGSRGLRENDYNVDDKTRGRDAFEEVKRTNQKYFAEKWAWALRGRRPTLAAERKHLEEIAALMRERRLDSGLTD